jgi:hypothetical protein
MPDPAQAAVTALAGSTTETVGQFSYDVATDSWWWSTNLYTIHGFAPGEIVPTTELMAAHQHPDDRPGAVELITTGKPFCSRHRILDAQRRVHTVITVGEGVRGDDDQIVQVRGCFIDLTQSLHHDLATATRLAVELSAGSRAAIEQAKGALMITYGIDEDEAFALLRWHSQHTNIKLRDIAAGIIDRTSDPGIAGLTADRKITEILADLTADDTAIPALAGISATVPDDHDERLSA